MKSLRFFFAALAVFTTAGCRCGPGTSKVSPEYIPTPTALSFEACPTKDESGHAVLDVYPDTKKLVIDNRSKAGSGLQLTVTGKDADAFKVGPDAPTSIDPVGQVEVPILFAPSKKGELSAQLVIDDLFDGTDNQTVTLAGTGKNLPSQPTIETAPQKTDASGFLTCVEGSALYDCTLQFPNTLFDQTATLQLKIKNKGCPALKITNLAIESNRGNTQGFEIVTPATLPSTTSPMLLSTADGTDETTLTIRFAPTDDGSGDPDRTASLVILSNDPVYGDGFAQPARIVLTGQAVKPSIYATPGICDYSNQADLCGYSVRTPNAARFRITNDGSASVQIESTKFRSTGTSTGVGGRFTITTGIEGQTLTPTQSATLEVAHTDQPLYVSDQLDVVAKIPGQASGSGGTITLALYGGLKPCLTTDPLDQMNFNNPSTATSAQPLHIKNGTGCGTLIVTSVAIDTNPFFSIIDPILTPGTQIGAGNEFVTNVQYTRPPSGGSQVSTLRINTNDSDFGPPTYKLVQLLSQSPLDQIPVAALTGCVPAQLLNDSNCALGASGSMSAQYSVINPKEITVSGITSYDPDPAAPGGKKAVAKYRFKLLPPFPPGVTTAALANNDTPITTPTTVLSVPAGGTGTYRVSLQVYDDRNQVSGNSSVMLISIYQ